ncbi:unnamed protein product [Eretmochelys imbricata]
MSSMLVPIFTALLYFSTAGALLCHMCVRLQPNKMCTGWKSCKADPEESCFIHTHSLGNNFVFAKMGCVSNCQDYVVGPYNWHIFHCCTKDFCNA